MDTSLAGSENLMFGRPISQVIVLKVGAPDVGSKFFTPQGEAGSCEYPLGCVSPGWRWGLW